MKRTMDDLLGEPVTPLEKIGAALDLIGESGDVAAGFLFYQHHAGRLCYVRELKTYFGFADGVWEPVEPDALVQAYCAERVSNAAEGLRVQRSGRVQRGGREDSKLELSRAAQLFDDIRRQDRMLKAAQAHMAVPASRFNRTPHLLGVGNGVLNLLTGKLVQAPADEYISKRMGCDYLHEAAAPMWVRFIAEILPDPEERALFQRWAGAALFGVVLDRFIMFLLGETGANGKSVTANVLTRVWGSYAMTASADLLLQTKHDTEFARQIAGLSMGPRLVTINEIPRGAVWDDGRVKMLASKDDIPARRLYGEAYSFSPTHHILIRANHAPGAQDSGEAFWGRIIPVEFGVQIPKAAQIGDLDEKLMAEASGILNWALAGAAAWRAAGRATGALGKLDLPDVTVAARERYRRSTDYFGRWLDENTEPGARKGTPLKVVWADYQDFCRASGLRNAGLDREFSDALEKCGYLITKSNGVRVVRNLMLKRERFND